FQRPRVGQTWGVELEGQLDFQGFYLLGNVTATNTVVFTDSFRFGLNSDRSLDGQMGWMADLVLGYSRGRHDLNVVLDGGGQRLHRAASPEVDNYDPQAEFQTNVFFQVPTRLSLAWTWRIFKTASTVGGIQVRGANLLDSTWRFTQRYDQGFGFRDQASWRRFNRGPELGVGLTFGIR
ncbi:MAG: hypothetical protein AAGA48_36565, partial [Myxococcota bacterium]